MPILILLIAFPALISMIEFFGFLVKGKRVVNIVLFRAVEIGAFIILPYLYVSPDQKNDCCGDSAVFSPDHQLTIRVLVVLCLIAYFYSSYRTKITTPVLEIATNCFLVTGIVLNVFIAIQTKDFFLAAGGNMPVILLAILVLVKNQKTFIEQPGNPESSPEKGPKRIARKILNLQWFLKFPVIFILCLPIITVITALLLLAGQKPDSLVRAFTDTYKHGFSQWDYQCDNVQCGGHYLCSVAANGHPEIVKPQRLGIRNGHLIICNRQLLIANAFEDLMQDNLPVLHRAIRWQYNKTGHFIHRHYHLFNNRFVSDFVYLLMKPLEWFFLLTLYTFDKNPENRIAKQYLSNADRQTSDKH